MLRPYLKDISKVAGLGDAREESYYSILEGLLNQYSESVGKKRVHITTLPKMIELFAVRLTPLLAPLND